MPLPTSLHALASFSTLDLLAHRQWLMLLLLPLMLAGCRNTLELSPNSPAETSVTLVEPQPSIDFTQKWIITAEEARSLLPQARLLDARGKSPLNNPLSPSSIDGAIAVTWQQFSEPQAPHRGNLLQDPAELGKRLQAVGIDRDRPVIVFGDPSKGWGEEGRIVWMLRSLGHQQAVLVDGGYGALKSAGLTAGKAIAIAPTAGDFVPQAQGDWQIDQEALQVAIAEPASGSIPTHSTNLALIDTREPREFAGATPYGESRGGHLPGAVNLHFAQLLDEQGYLLPKTEIRDRLTALGITPDQSIVAYCTGGIRSGWLTAVLFELGYDVKNYAGSMWEWSAGNAEEFPLEKS